MAVRERVERESECVYVCVCVFVRAHAPVWVYIGVCVCFARKLYCLFQLLLPWRGPRMYVLVVTHISSNQNVTINVFHPKPGQVFQTHLCGTRLSLPNTFQPRESYSSMFYDVFLHI